jgi:hypothetical protein
MPTINQRCLLPLLGHFALVCGLYVWLTLVRQRAVHCGEAKLSDFVRADGDPTGAKRIQRNLSNQFELPVFVYFAATLLLQWQAIGWFDVAAAWLFLVGRVIHTGVQTLTDNVALRGQVFVLNFLGVAGLMAHVAWHGLIGP